MREQSLLLTTMFQQDGTKSSMLCGSPEKGHLDPDGWGYWWEADECPKRCLEQSGEDAPPRCVPAEQGRLGEQHTC